MTSDGDIIWKWWSMVLAWRMKGYTWHKPVLALLLLAVGMDITLVCHTSVTKYLTPRLSNVLAKKWSDQKSSFILWLALENGEV